MTTLKSLSHNLKRIEVNPFESPIQTAKSINHRIHRSKKNRNKWVNDIDSKIRKQKIEKAKLLQIEKYGI